MKFFDAFAGIGGFHRGITEAIPEAKCTGFSEIDKYASSVYKKNFNVVENYGDIRKMDELPKGTDLLCGGFPCQAFSIAGKRQGFEDTRGTLFFELARLLRKSKPKYFLFENVKGLLSHDEEKTIKTILATIGQLGYDCQWQIMDSQDWGLAQHRERIFIAGHLRTERRPKIFPLRKTNSAAYTEQRLKEKQQIAQTLRARDYANWNGNFVLKQVGTLGKGGQGQRIYSTEGLATTLASNAGGQGAKTGLYLIPILTPDRPNKRQNGRRFKKAGEPSFTLTAQDRHGIVIIENEKYAIRRFTPLECERLQGFPDHWTKYGTDGEPISDSQRYKMLGNAVSVNVVREIMEQM